MSMTTTTLTYNARRLPLLSRLGDYPGETPALALFYRVRTHA